MVVPVDISIPAADAVVRMVSFLYRRHCGIRFAVLRLAAVRVVRRTVILAASQPGILTGGVSAVGICGVRCRACFLRQRRRWQHGEAERQSHEQAQNSFFHRILLRNMCIPLYETRSVRALFYWSSEMSHSFFAAVLSSLRRFTPSLLSTLLTWLLTVETRMFRISPISALLFRADQPQHLHLRCRQ